MRHMCSLLGVRFFKVCAGWAFRHKAVFHARLLANRCCSALLLAVITIAAMTSALRWSPGGGGLEPLVDAGSAGTGGGPAAADVAC